MEQALGSAYGLVVLLGAIVFGLGGWYLLGYLVAMPLTMVVAPLNAAYRRRAPRYAVLGMFLFGLSLTALTSALYVGAAWMAVAEYKRGVHPWPVWMLAALWYFGSGCVAAYWTATWWEEGRRRFSSDLLSVGGAGTSEPRILANIDQPRG